MQSKIDIPFGLVSTITKNRNPKFSYLASPAILALRWHTADRFSQWKAQAKVKRIQIAKTVPNTTKCFTPWETAAKNIQFVLLFFSVVLMERLKWRRTRTNITNTFTRTHTHIGVFLFFFMWCFCCCFLFVAFHFRRTPSWLESKLKFWYTFRSSDTPPTPYNIEPIIFHLSWRLCWEQNAHTHTHTLSDGPTTKQYNHDGSCWLSFSRRAVHIGSEGLSRCWMSRNKKKEKLDQKSWWERFGKKNHFVSSCQICGR